MSIDFVITKEQICALLSKQFDLQIVTPRLPN